MRKIITIVFLFAFPFLVPGQDHVAIKLRCPAFITKIREPILVVNGILWEYAALDSIDPGEIESIDILKRENATAIFGCRALNGVVLITTKERKFVVRDIESGTVVAGATVSFAPASGKGDTIISATDERGYLITHELKKGETYHVGISSIGYKRASVIYENKNGSTTAFDLEREVLSCSPVVVTAYGQTIRCYLNCCLSGIRITRCEMNRDADLQKTGNRFPVYPNPVQKGSNLTIELENPVTQAISISLLNLNGQLLSKKTISAVKGYDHYTMNIDPRLAAGAYFIQVTASTGKILKQEKIIIQ